MCITLDSSTTRLNCSYPTAAMAVSGKLAAPFPWSSRQQQRSRGLSRFRGRCFSLGEGKEAKASASGSASFPIERGSMRRPLIDPVDNNSAITCFISPTDVETAAIRRRVVMCERREDTHWRRWTRATIAETA